MKFSAILFSQTTDTDRGTAAGPDALLRAGLIDFLRENGHDVAGPFRVHLTPDEEAAYGAWNKIGFANRELAKLVLTTASRGTFPLILESNCYGAIGALAGLQLSPRASPPRLGIVWIDAHGDCNTPETTLSGMLSGMPVAIACGLCLERLRKQSGLDRPVDPQDIVMVCVRANDPLEEELINQAGIGRVPVADIKEGCSGLRAAMDRLSGGVDLIYVHFDADALDSTEVVSMWLTAPDGPTRGEVAAALKIIMSYPKIAAFGIADINPERDHGGQVIGAVLTVITGAIAGFGG
jgi:arginase